MSEREFTEQELERMRIWDEAEQDQVELDEGRTVAKKWRRKCTACGNGYTSTEPTRRVFDKQTYRGVTAYFPRVIIPKPHICPKCANGNSSSGLKE